MNRKRVSMRLRCSTIVRDFVIDLNLFLKIKFKKKLTFLFNKSILKYDTNIKIYTTDIFLNVKTTSKNVD